jgi:hypothetical protein
MKTEAEAKKLWCPHARYGGGGDENLGNDYQMTNNIGAKCVASRCMMWRWEVYTSLVEGMYREGFCGLACKPLYEPARQR